ncbi:protachykinin [Genypterus blacodes]|uniref:protachykinin n=1 Tax=Genypterus blacodes TaxID=154954 RepID=UPI003F7712F0
MRIVALVLIALLLLSNVFSQEMDLDRWRGGVEESLQDMLVRMSRKPNPRQYLGLMGKKSSARTQLARKRHKFQTFVGLMGKRSFED